MGDDATTDYGEDSVRVDPYDPDAVIKALDPSIGQGAESYVVDDGFGSHPYMGPAIPGRDAQSGTGDEPTATGTGYEEGPPIQTEYGYQPPAQGYGEGYADES